MTPAGVSVSARESVPSRTIPTDISPAFMVLALERGPLLGQFRSFQDFVDTCTSGERVSDYAVAWDEAEGFFTEQGSVLNVSRLLGPAPVKASKTFNDSAGEPAATMKVEAANYGAYYNNWEAAVVVDGTSFQVVVTDSARDDAEVVTSPLFGTVAEAVAWAATSGPSGGPRTDINIIDDATSAGDPAAVSATALTGGTDDIANATSATRKTAIDRFPRSLGPGQIGVPGDGTAQTHVDLVAHGAANNRVAVLDGADIPSTSTLITTAGTVRASQYSGRELPCWPWATAQGPLPGQTRKVPYSGVQMGIIARNDAAGLNPNTPAAADNGVSLFATGVTQQVPTDNATLTDLEEAGINPVKVLPNAGGGNVVELYDYLTVADPNTHPQRVDFGTARLIMAIVAKGEQIGLKYVLKLIDGRGLLLSKFQGELQSMLKAYWDTDALYGETPQDAYRVDVGPSVNTPESIAAKKIRAVCSIRPSVPARNVDIQFVTVPITAQLPA